MVATYLGTQCTHTYKLIDAWCVNQCFPVLLYMVSSTRTTVQKRLSYISRLSDLMNLGEYVLVQVSAPVSVYQFVRVYEGFIQSYNGTRHTIRSTSTGMLFAVVISPMRMAKSRTQMR
jgi:hypothetical protein